MKNNSIIPSPMDSGYEIHSEEYAKRHTNVAFEYDNSPLFKEASDTAENMTMGELEDYIDILIALLDARSDTSRKIAYDN